MWPQNRYAHNSAVFWRDVISVFFVIFELGPDSESLCKALPSESNRCGIMAFFHPKNWLRSFGPEKFEKSWWCKKHLQFWFWRNVIMVLLSTPIWRFVKTDMKHLYDISPFFLKPHHDDVSLKQTWSTFLTFLLFPICTIRTFLQTNRIGQKCYSRRYWL